MKKYNKSEIDELSNILKNNGVISVPTDTVYGLCARINSEDSYNKLVELKKRPPTKSFPVMCSNIQQIKSIGVVDERVEKLINAFMPGPITLVLNKKGKVNNRGTTSTSEVAVRMAPSDDIKELIEKTQSPIFMTSANISGEDVCNSVDDIEKIFPNIDGILVGNTSYGKSSTIVDCTNTKIIIQREGPISEKQIKKVLEYEK